MNAEVDAFLDSQKTDTPPAVAVPLLRAVWHGLRGEWKAAHHIAQDDAFSATCAASSCVGSRISERARVLPALAEDLQHQQEEGSRSCRSRLRATKVAEHHTKGMVCS